MYAIWVWTSLYFFYYNVGNLDAGDELRLCDDIHALSIGNLLDVVSELDLPQNF